jgi:hypothetical protein
MPNTADTEEKKIKQNPIRIREELAEREDDSRWSKVKSTNDARTKANADRDDPEKKGSGWAR